MKLVDFAVIAVLAAIVGLAVWYVYKSKKSGKRCIGCPDGAKCAGNCAGCSGNCAGCNMEK